jgi:hypothetical protein
MNVRSAGVILWFFIPFFFKKPTLAQSQASFLHVMQLYLVVANFTTKLHTAVTLRSCLCLIIILVPVSIYKMTEITISMSLLRTVRPEISIHVSVKGIRIFLSDDY